MLRLRNLFRSPFRSRRPSLPKSRTRPREDERPPVVEPKRKRGFGSIVMSAIDKINKGFSAAEDEEI